MIARDEQFQRIVNVIPIVGGFISVSRDGENSIQILSAVRDFKLKFCKEDEGEIWFNDILSLSGSRVLE